MEIHAASPSAKLCQSKRSELNIQCNHFTLVERHFCSRTTDLEKLLPSTGNLSRFC